MKIVAIKDGQVLATFEFDHKLVSTKDIWVGRGEDCHLVLRDPKVSRLIGHFKWQQNQLVFLTETNPQTSIQIWPSVPFIWQGVQFLTEGFENTESSSSKENKNKKTIPEKVETNLDQSPIDINEDQIPLDTPAMLQETLANIGLNNTGNNNTAFNLNLESQEENAASNDVFNDPNNQFLSQNNEGHHQESHHPSELQLVDSQFQSEAASLDSPSTKTKFIPQFLQYVLKCQGKGIPYEHFFLEDEKILIGSDSKCQFKVNDVTFPSIAAELKREGGVYSITSLNSSVELIINGKVVNKTMLNDGQHFKLGQLSFDVVVQSEIMHQENAALMPVDLVDDETKEYKFAQESKKLEEESKEKSKKEKKRTYNFNLKEIWSNPKRRIILYVVVLGLFAVLFDEDKNSGDVPTTDPKVAAADGSGADASNVEKTDFSGGDKKKSGDKTEEKNKDSSKTPNVDSGEVAKAKELTPEEKDYVNSHYQLAVSYIEKGEYLPALSEIDLVRSVDEKYRDVQILSNLAKDGLKKIEEEEKRKKDLEEKLVREGKVKELVTKAQDALRNDELIAAENLIAMVVEIDPENSEVHNIKLEIEARKEDLRLKEEQLKLKEERRSNLVELLLPGKGFFIQKEWFKAMMKINEFLLIKDNDEDLITQASEMLAQSKKEMDLELAPLLSSARSAKSKEDLKEAYENYIKILKINPSHDEALTESKEMKEVLNERARKIFREAMYKESINLYLKAREKFQEVLLVAPSDSEYYQRAESRLKKLYVD
ncbi:MAG: FHA domain-containing protein [Bacteriovoracaceae bacterium]|nr:FHA domain-containing protein [Bacteriovoracaceae bacterium]